MKRLLIIALLVVPFLNVVAQEVGGAGVVAAFDTYSTGDENSVKVLIELAEEFKTTLASERSELQAAIDDKQKVLERLSKELAETKAQAEKESVALKEQLGASKLSDAEKKEQLDTLTKEHDDLKAAKEALDEAQKDLDKRLKEQENALKENKTLSEQQSKDLEASRNAFENAQDKYTKEKEEYEEQVEKLNEELSQTQGTATESLAEIGRLKTIITQLNEKIKTSQATLTTALGTLKEEEK
jgi:chromosome segregation ATPase